MLFPCSHPILGLSSVLKSWNGTGLQRSASHEVAQHFLRPRAFLCILIFRDSSRLMAQLQPEQALFQRIQAAADGGIHLGKTRGPIRWGNRRSWRCRGTHFGLLLRLRHNCRYCYDRLASEQNRTQREYANKPRYQRPFQNVQPPGNLLDTHSGGFAALLRVSALLAPLLTLI